MKKNIPKILLILLLLSGCINYEQITTVRGDNSGEMFIHYWVKVKLPIDSTFFTRIGVFNKKKIAEVFDAPFVELNEVEVYVNAEDSSLHAQIDFDFKDFNKLVSLKPFKGTSLAITKAPNGNKKFVQFIKPFSLPFEITPGNFSIEYTYYLPGKILNSNANEVSLNKLYWKFTPEELQNGKFLNATFRPFRLNETPKWIYYLAVFVLVVVLVFLFSKKYS